MIFYFFYFLISPLLFLFIHIIKFFNKKIKDHLDNETDSIKNVIISLSQIDRTKIKILIFHAASSGEYEQLKPILKRINRKKYFIIQSFTSPTIYNKESKSNLFDVCCYHPYDIWWKSYFFLKDIKPDIYCITRHDVWPTHLFIANKLDIKTMYINANIHEDSIWLNFLMKKISKFIFNQFFLCLVPSKRIYKNLSQIVHPNKIMITGDSRFDQILDRHSENLSKKYFSSEYFESFNIIFGSYDKYDEGYIFSALDYIYSNKDQSLHNFNHRIILVPHEVDKKTLNRTKNKLNSLGISYSLYSNSKNDKINSRVMIVDTVGILADIYKYCKIAYVGSGFGRGVHSVIEPGVHNCAVGFGPNIKLLDEARDIYSKNAGVMINNKMELINFLKLYKEKKTLNKLCNNIKIYIQNKKNASTKIIDIIEKYV